MSELVENNPKANPQIDSEGQVYLSSQWQLMWLRFKKHKLAMFGILVLATIYMMGIFCEFVSPYDPYTFDRRYVNVPPQRPRFFSDEGFHLRPFVYGLERQRDPETLRISYTIDRSQKYPLYFFVRGEPYKFWGLWDTDIRLFGVEEGHVYLFGTDHLGRDMFSRIMYGARISTSIGLLGVILSFVLGVCIGGISGYVGGVVDDVIQRVIEFIRSLPTIPLWMGLAAAIPADWPLIKTYFAITLVLSLIGWSGLAREVRSKFISLREEDFVLSARLIGASEVRVIFGHMIPSFISHIIASLTLAIPGMILAETSLSYLGLGLRPPAISWGVLLQLAQNVRTIAFTPWLLLPGLFVIITVLSFNFVGDALRDAADPYV